MQNWNTSSIQMFWLVACSLFSWIYEYCSNDCGGKEDKFLGLDSSVIHWLPWKKMLLFKISKLYLIMCVSIINGWTERIPALRNWLWFYNFCKPIKLSFPGRFKNKTHCGSLWVASRTFVSWHFPSSFSSGDLKGRWPLWKPQRSLSLMQYVHFYKHS